MSEQASNTFLIATVIIVCFATLWWLAKVFGSKSKNGDASSNGVTKPLSSARKKFKENRGWGYTALVMLGIVLLEIVGLWAISPDTLRRYWENQALFWTVQASLAGFFFIVWFRKMKPLNPFVTLILDVLAIGLLIIVASKFYIEFDKGGSQAAARRVAPAVAALPRPFPCNSPGHLDSVYVPIGTDRVLTLRGPDDEVVVCVPKGGALELTRFFHYQYYTVEPFTKSGKRWDPPYEILPHKLATRELPDSTLVRIRAPKLKPHELFKVTVAMSRA